MKFTKEPPYSMGELVCLINATIEILALNVPKLSKPFGFSEIDIVLSNIGYGYQPTTQASQMWIQFMDMIEKMKLEQKCKELILEKADYLFKDINNN